MQVCWQVMLASRSHKPQLDQLYRAVICVMYRVWQNEALDSSVQTVAMDACQNVQHLLQTAQPSPAASNSTACPKSRSATDKCQQARSTCIAWHVKGHMDCLHRNNHSQSAVITPLSHDTSHAHAPISVKSAQRYRSMQAAQPPISLLYVQNLCEQSSTTALNAPSCM